MSYKNYRHDLREAAMDKSLVGKIENADILASASNFSCQDSVSLSIKLSPAKDTVEEILYECSGCLLSQASSAILVKYAKSKNLSELANISNQKIYQILEIEENSGRADCFLLAWKIFLEKINSMGKY